MIWYSGNPDGFWRWCSLDETGNEPLNAPNGRGNHTKEIAIVEPFFVFRVIEFSFCSCVSW